MDIKDELIAAWKGIKKPTGFVADIGSKSEAEMEYKDIETYFSGRDWQDVNPEAEGIRYMFPLLWMNAEAAKYYALSYLIYLVSPRAVDSQFDIAESTISYFTDPESGVVPKLNTKQQDLVRRAISVYNKKASR